MTDVQTHYWTASDGIQLAWREVGEGRPVILLHGLFSDATVNWIKFGHAERIAAEGFRVIMPDLRAHGLSGKPHEPESYPRGVLVRDLQELIAHLGLTDFDLGGFSLGARTVIEAVVGGMRPRRAILAGTGLDVLTNWNRRKAFLHRGHRPVRHRSARRPAWWLAIQFMKTMKVDRAPPRLLLRHASRMSIANGRGLHHADAGACAATRTTTMARRPSWPRRCPTPNMPRCRART